MTIIFTYIPIHSIPFLTYIPSSHTDPSLTLPPFIQFCWCDSSWVGPFHGKFATAGKTSKITLPPSAGMWYRQHGGVVGQHELPRAPPSPEKGWNRKKNLEVAGSCYKLSSCRLPACCASLFMPAPPCHPHACLPTYQATPVSFFLPPLCHSLFSQHLSPNHILTWRWRLSCVYGTGGRRWVGAFSVSHPTYFLWFSWLVVVPKRSWCLVMMFGMGS